jgi:formylglycine-generating enzyme required for sulfatase activity
VALLALCGSLAASSLPWLGPPPRARGDAAEDQVVDLTLTPGGKAFTNGVGMKFVSVRKGKFLMGSPVSERLRAGDEPQHEVEITRDFYLGAFEVTQKQYQQVTGKNPSAFRKGGGSAAAVQGIDTSDFPVEWVTWNDAAEFVRKLNAREPKKSGWQYSLPTEAQWEYACRGGPDASTKPFRFARPSDTLSLEEANFDREPYGGKGGGKSLGRTAKVGSYRPNNLGLYDMHGNVWEWCADWHANDYGGTGKLRDPLGPAKGSYHVVKGGCYYNEGSWLRSAVRYPCSGTSGIGFRVAFVQSR